MPPLAVLPLASAVPAYSDRPKGLPNVMSARLVASVSAAFAANSCAWPGDEALDSPVPLPSRTITLSPARTRMRIWAM